MVKLTEVEDEHFVEKPIGTKNDALLLSDDEDDYTDTDSEISDASDDELEEETIYDRHRSPSARHTVTNSIDAITSFGKASLSFSGKALWIISTSAFLIGVPWALAYAEEEQYIQMEREQGMIKGANEMLTPGSEPEKNDAAQQIL
ncbi:Mitochondrial outer membrane translocase complex subunit Tom22 [Penicillium herquei]|nr:Mitochondrial outer membrane translocase complex subunit Tom22 [Penicillium herquei]